MPVEILAFILDFSLHLQAIFFVLFFTAFAITALLEKPA